MSPKIDSGDAVVVERTLNAPPARVWRALTDVDEMRQWYFDLKEFRAEIGFEFEFTVEDEGNRYHHLCRVAEVIPEKRLAYTWRYKGEPGDSLVTFELFGDGDSTRVKVTHTGIDTFPTTPAYARHNFVTGWTHILDSELRRFVEGTKKADP
ncbi:MAG: SRPBCC family protein [Chthoniobacterales bacterium]